MIVEYFGYPGAGKTHALRKQTKLSGIRIINPRLMHRILFVFLGLLISLKYWPAIFRFNSIKNFYIFLSLRGVDFVSKCLGKKVYLDQGYAQLLCSEMYCGKGETRASELLIKHTRNSEILYIEVNRNISWDRFKTREINLTRIKSYRDWIEFADHVDEVWSVLK